MRTELHRHLDVSLRPSTIAELSRAFATNPSFADETEVRERLWITDPMGSLAAVLDRFSLFPHLLRNAAVLERVACEAVEDARAEGIGRVEFRYAPAFTSAVSGQPWGEALDAFERGLAEGTRRTGVTTGLICIIGRRFSMDIAERAMDFAIAHKHRFLAVDLAGPEAGIPCRPYQAIFRRALDAGLRVTIHAGEAAGPENVWQAIDLLGATRIGHGINAVKDDALMRRLARDGILLETCPTSNVITRAVPDWRSHPLPIFLERGIPVSISTDDPSVFGVTLGDEFRLAGERIGLSGADLARVGAYADQHSFLN